MDRKDDDFVVMFERTNAMGNIRMIKAIVSAVDGEIAISSARSHLNLKQEEWKVTKVTSVIVTQVFARPGLE